LSALGFGGQIVPARSTQRDLVDDRRWISREEFLIIGEGFLGFLLKGGIDEIFRIH